MRGPANRLIVHVEKSHIDTVEVGGVTMYQDTSYRPNHHVATSGINAFQANTIPEGATVYFHYLCLTPERLVAPKTYSIDIDMAFCFARKGNITMLQDFVLVDPLPDPPKREVNGILLPPEKHSFLDSTIAYANKDTPVPVGTRVIFKASCADTYTIEGRPYYIMRNQDLLAESTREEDPS